MKLTQSQVESINEKCPSDQGVFVQPYGIPVHIKEPVIYCRWESGGYSGGSCWDDNAPQRYRNDTPKDRMQVLDIVLKEIRPQTTFLEYRQIEGLVHDNSETKYEYYGNSTDYQIEYIVLSELYELLETF